MDVSKYVRSESFDVENLLLLRNLHLTGPEPNLDNSDDRLQLLIINLNTWFEGFKATFDFFSKAVSVVILLLPNLEVEQTIKQYGG